MEKVETALEERDPTFENPVLQNISSGKDGEVEIDYIQGKSSDPTAPKTAVIKGDEVHINYVAQDLGTPELITTAMVKYVDKTKVLDLTDIESWTPQKNVTG